MKQANCPIVVLISIFWFLVRLFLERNYPIVVLISISILISVYHLWNSSITVLKLEFNRRIVLATVIRFLGSAFGTVGGVGGGGIFVLIVGFDTKSVATISKCMILWASTSSDWYNLRIPHPCREVLSLEYDLAFLFRPMLLLRITLGVALSVVFPYWLFTVLIILHFQITNLCEYHFGCALGALINGPRDWRTL